MKKSAVISIAMCALLLTACGSSSKSSDTQPAVNGYSYYDEAGGGYDAEDAYYDDADQSASTAETAAAAPQASGTARARLARRQFGQRSFSRLGKQRNACIFLHHKH